MPYINYISRWKIPLDYEEKVVEENWDPNFDTRLKQDHPLHQDI